MAWETGTATDYKDLLDRLLNFATSKGTIASPIFSGTGNGTITEVESVSKAISEIWTLDCSNATKVGVADYRVTVAADSPVLHWRLGDGAGYGVADYSVTVLAASPVLYWRLNEVAGTVAADSTANGLDGTIAGTPALGVTGLLAVDTNKALQFDGVDDTVVSAANALVQITGDLTFECVINQTDSTGVQNIAALAVTGSTSADNTLLSIQAISGDIALSHEYAVNTVETVATGISLVTGVTYHLAVTRDVTANEYLLYLNGELKYTWPYTNDPTGGSNTYLSLGKTPDLSDYFIGVVDEAALYATKLSASTVLQHSKDAVGILTANLTIVDETVNAIDGTAVFTQSSSGLLSVDTDPSLTFNGVNSRVVSSPEALLQNIADITAECVIRPTGLSGISTILAIGADGETNADNHIIKLGTANEYLTIFHEYSSGFDISKTTGVKLLAGLDYHVALVRDSTAKVYSLYLDGVLVYEFAYIFNPSEGTNSYLVVGSDVDSTNYFSGIIDEVAIYPTALNASTVLAHAKAAKGHETFTVTGSISGVQTDTIVGLRYANTFLKFLINDGTTDFIVTDDFTLTLTTGALGTQAWKINRQEDDIVYLEGPGLSETDNIYCSIRTYEDADLDYFNWELRGYDGYTADQDDDNQVNPSNPTYTPLIDQSISYWFVVSGRRIIVIAKTSTNYHCCYLGLFLPFATPTQYPYPILIGGSSGIETARWSSTSTNIISTSGGIGSFWDASSNCAYIRKPNASWTHLSNAYNEVTKIALLDFVTNPYSASDRNVHGWATLYMREGLSGEYPLTPITILNTTAENPTDVGVWAELDGCFYVTGFGNASENIVNDGSFDYLVIQNTFRTGIADYMALRLD